MKYCANCNTENESNSKFCRVCGSPLAGVADSQPIGGFVPGHDNAPVYEQAPVQQPSPVYEQAPVYESAPYEQPNEKAKKPGFFASVKNSVFFRKKKNTIITIVSMVLSIALIVGILNCGFIAFQIAYNSGNYDACLSIKDWPINNNSTKQNIDNFVSGKAEEYYNEYLNESITYEQVLEKYDIIAKFRDTGDIRYRTMQLKESKEAFELGLSYEEENDLHNAILEYKKVSEDDINYSQAQSKIETLVETYKTEVTDQLEDYYSYDNYNDALTLIYSAEIILEDDADIASYKETFTEMKKEYQIQEYKDTQKVVVTSAYTFDNSKNVTTVIRNKHSYVLEEATVVVLFFDSNGNPVAQSEIEYQETGATNSMRGSTGTINIGPGSSYGDNYYWSVQTGGAKVKACVKEAKFKTAGTWTNPYFSYWLEEEKSSY